jgi:poly(A) polymerase Pap1
VNNLKDSLSNIIKEYVDGIKDEEKIRDKFKVYTETIIIALNDLIMDIPVKTLSSKRFQKKMYDMIWKYYRSEVLKYDIFSK